jgi:hypothetical protein
MYIVRQKQSKYSDLWGEQRIRYYYWLCENKRNPKTGKPQKKKLLYLGKHRPPLAVAIARYKLKKQRQEERERDRLG